MCYALSNIALDNILGEIDKNVVWYFPLNWFCETVYRHIMYRLHRNIIFLAPTVILRFLNIVFGLKA